MDCIRLFQQGRRLSSKIFLRSILFRLNHKEDELALVSETIKSGWLTMGPKTIEFEKKFKDYIGSKYSISTNSATSALHLSLNAIGVTSNIELTKKEYKPDKILGIVEVKSSKNIYQTICNKYSNFR